MYKKIKLYFKSPWDEDEVKDVFRQKRNSFNLNNFNFDFDKGMLSVFALVILGLWVFSGVYQIKEGEEGAIMRFGKFVRKASPGLNYHIPFPIENVFIEKVNQSRRIEMGYRSSGSRNDSKSMLNESIMLTGDENIVELNCDIRWHIKNLEDYLINVSYQENAIRTVSESAIREVIGRTPIASVLSNQKQEIALEIEQLIQRVLDEYNIGVHIEQVQLLKAEPPVEVIDSYRDVQTARADKEREINQAQAYRNDNIPKARGESQKMLEEAGGYKQEVISMAEGEVKRFDSVYKEYVMNRQVTRDRLYLEASQEVLKNNSKIITNGVFPHMQINKN